MQPKTTTAPKIKQFLTGDGSVRDIIFGTSFGVFFCS
jgi:hypothetical protein